MARDSGSRRGRARLPTLDPMFRAAAALLRPTRVALVRPACWNPSLTRSLCAPAASPRRFRDIASLATPEELARMTHAARRHAEKGVADREAEAAETGVAASYTPDYSRAGRRARLQAALARAAQGEPFEIEKAQRRAMPGPCGAVMNVLRRSEPLKLAELYDAVEQRYPGVLRSRNHLKTKILRVALVNKIMKVKLPTGTFKDRWTLRKKGQVRLKIARD